MQWVVNRFYLRWAGSWFPSQATWLLTQSLPLLMVAQVNPSVLLSPILSPTQRRSPTPGPPLRNFTGSSTEQKGQDSRDSLVHNIWVRPLYFFFLLKYFLDDHPGFVRTSFIYFCGPQHVPRYQPSWELSRGANISRSPPQTYWIRNSGSGDEKSK